MGLALFWKEVGPTSQEKLGDIKRQLGLEGRSRKGIGHNGTLDPFAEGLLFVGWEEGKKLLHPLSGLSKGYEAEMLLAVGSETLDIKSDLDFSKLAECETKITSLNSEGLARFGAGKLAKFEQIPPQFSAKHVDGKRAYEWARMGVEKELKAKEVEIHAFEHISLRNETIQEQEVTVWKFRVEVSAGCYIRALARDWSLELTGAAGILKSLKRYSIGPFQLKESDKDHRAIEIRDLSSLFEIRRIDVQGAEKLRKFGKWKAQPCKQRLLLVDPFGEAIAWCEAPGGQIGRVFRENPLEFKGLVDS